MTHSEFDQMVERVAEHLVRFGTLPAVRTAVDGIAIGAFFLKMKVVKNHGEFLPVIEKIGCEASWVQRLMRLFLRFNKWPIEQLRFVGSSSHLLELAKLDEEQTDALARGETVEGLNLADISCMTVLELREAVRELKRDEVFSSEFLQRERAKADRIASITGHAAH